MAEPEPEVLTVGEAAKFLRVSESQVRALLREGQIPGNKIGREWRIVKSDLLNHLRGKAGKIEGDR